jgi:predicted nucleic acid-binding protein
MSSILIDSSAWIEYFRGNKEYLFITELIKNNSICTNDMILTELLPSMIQKKEKKLVELMNSIKKYDIEIIWNELQNLQLMNLQHGNNNVPVTDLIITQNCLQNGLVIIAQEKQFKLMSEYIPVKIYEKKAVNSRNGQSKRT